MRSAELFYRSEIENHPNDAEHHYKYGCLLFDMKKLGDADKEFKICL